MSFKVFLRIFDIFTICHNDKFEWHCHFLTVSAHAIENKHAKIFWVKRMSVFCARTSVYWYQCPKTRCITLVTRNYSRYPWNLIEYILSLNVLIMTQWCPKFLWSIILYVVVRLSCWLFIKTAFEPGTHRRQRKFN